MAVGMRAVEGSEPRSQGSGPPSAPLGGVRADFVAALGRRIADIHATLRQLDDEPRAARLRDDLRRRVHALAAGARLLRFTALMSELGEAEALLDAAAQRGEVTEADVVALRAMLERLPALAWGHTAATEASAAPLAGVEITPSPAPARAIEPGAISLAAPLAAETTADFPLTVLVVGPAALADALTQEIAADAGAPGLEIERTEDNTAAIDVARALAPDVVILDADRPGARELATALASDALTEPVPVVVVGRFAKPEEAAPFVALGAARVLAKPASPGALRRACAEVAATYVRREVAREPVGSVTLDELGARLAEELRRGLCDAADAKTRVARVELGEGSEVLAAIWGAVARVRDVVTIRSSGEVRFSPNGPEGALPLASFGVEPLGERRALAPAAGRAGEAKSLERLKIVVADDDAAVTWFLAGVLRAAGAIVHEAHDGERALAASFRVAPDLVISDVLMPKMDGFALCRALKRDVVLRDTPVILLSWKEDLLQRVRELGGGADGYLRKEASAAVVVQRVREVLRPRSRVAERLAAPGEVRGRLDGLTTRTLLDLCCRKRPSSTLAVRDASFLYEVEIRGGRPARATRTASDGTFQRGPSVLAAMLGVGSGRFTIAPAHDDRPLRADLDGSLHEQLLPAIAGARAAQRLLSGAALVQVERVSIAEDLLATYLDATPEPARSLLRTIAAGASPRALVTSGQAPARLVEDVLCDAAAHGAIAEIVDRTGEDRLFAAIEEETRVLRGERAPMASGVVMPELDLGVGDADELDDDDHAMDAGDRSRDEEDDVDAHDDDEDEADVAIDEPDAIEDADVAPRIPAIAAPTEVVWSVEPPSVAPPKTAVPPRLATLGSLTPPPVLPSPPAPAPARVAAPAERTTPRPPPPRPREERDDTPDPRRYPRPSAYAPRATAPAEPQRTSASTWILLAVAGVAFAVAARWAREPHAPPEPVPPPTVAAPAPAPAPAPSTTAVAAAAPSSAPSADDKEVTQDLPLRAEDHVPDGQGMLEVVAGAKDMIYVDHRMIGEGPVVKLPLAPRKEPYEVRVKLRGEERVRFATVKQGRLARVRVAPPWTR